MPARNNGQWWRNLIPNFRSVDLVALKKQMPEVGDRFFEVAAPHHVWTVDRFIRSSVCNIPHVIIQRAGTVPASKIISLAVLLDRRKFRTDRRNPNDLSSIESQERRRKTDVPLKGDKH